MPHDALKEQDVATSARIISSRAGGYGLSPDLPPGRTFDLPGWYLTTTGNERSGEDASHFVHAKWGIHRCILDWENHRADKENIRFANFSVSEVTLDNERNGCDEIR